MFRSLPYIIIFLMALFAQLFLVDPLSPIVYVAPLVYIFFIVVLPVETPQIVMLALGVALGAVMDITMGTQGLNSIATIAIAVWRTPLLRLLVGKERLAEQGTPSVVMLGGGGYFQYIALIVAIHHLIFFLFESLSIAHPLFLLVRFVISTSISILLVWLISRILYNANILK